MPVADDDDYHEDDAMFGPLGPGERVISYNLPRGKRPDGMKVRYKIKIISGARAKEIDARQAEAILEVLRWIRDHPDQQEQADQDH
jgi:hypothetical protein